jgi:hypothetical protein
MSLGAGGSSRLVSRIRSSVACTDGSLWQSLCPILNIALFRRPSRGRRGSRPEEVCERLLGRVAVERDLLFEVGEAQTCREETAAVRGKKRMSSRGKKSLNGVNLRRQDTG